MGEAPKARQSKANPQNVLRESGYARISRAKSLESLADQSTRINKLYDELQGRDTRKALRLMRGQYSYDEGMELMDNVRGRERRKKKADEAFRRYFNNARSYALRYGQLGNRTISGPTGLIKVPRSEYAR